MKQFFYQGKNEVKFSSYRQPYNLQQCETATTGFKLVVLTYRDSNMAEVKIDKIILQKKIYNSYSSVKNRLILAAFVYHNGYELKYFQQKIKLI